MSMFEAAPKKHAKGSVTGNRVTFSAAKMPPFIAAVHSTDPASRKDWSEMVVNDDAAATKKEQETVDV